jgi:hypothetical protein
MVTEKSVSRGQILTIAGGFLSIASVFLTWFGVSSSDGSILSVNGLAWKSGSGLVFGIISENFNWQFQGLGVLILGIGSIVVACILREKLQGIAMAICGLLIIGGGVVNLYSLKDIGSFSGTIMDGLTIQSGIGYGLYLVVLAGIVTAAGGALAWQDTKN